MSNQLIHPGKGFKKAVSSDLPIPQPRKIYVPAGDVTFSTVQGDSVTVVEADLAAINNQPMQFNSITAFTHTHIYTTD